MAQARSWEHASGPRGRDHVRPARAPGARGGAADGAGRPTYYEAGCAFAIDGETTTADRRDGPRRERHRLRADGGSGRCRSCSSSTSRAGFSSTTRRGTGAASSPTSSAARSTIGEAERACSKRSGAAPTCGCSTTARVGREMAAIERPDARLPACVPKMVSKGSRGQPPAPARAATTPPISASPLGTPWRTSRWLAGGSGASSSSPTGPSGTPGCGRPSRRWDNVDGDRGQRGRRLLRGAGLDPGRARGRGLDAAWGWGRSGDRATASGATSSTASGPRL